MAINRIIQYMLDEDFPVHHVNAILRITRAFNFSKESEIEIFAFANEMDKKYSAFKLEPT